MIKTKYNDVPKQLYVRYMDSLIARVFKILPLKDEKSPTVNTYIENLCFELTANEDLIKALKNDGKYLSLISNLNGLLCDDTNYRNVILGCLPLIKDLKNKYLVSGVKA